MFERWEKAKKVWMWLGTFGLVKPVGVLGLGVLAYGGVEAAARESAQVLHWVLGLLAALAGVGAAIWTYMWRREGVRRPELFGRVWCRPTAEEFTRIYLAEPEPAPVTAVEPEPWTYKIEVVPRTPAAIDPPRVFIAGQVIREREDVGHV